MTWIHGSPDAVTRLRSVELIMVDELSESLVNVTELSC